MELELRKIEIKLKDEEWDEDEELDEDEEWDEDEELDEDEEWDEEEDEDDLNN